MRLSYHLASWPPTPYKKHICTIFSVALAYIIPGAEPLCCPGKASSCCVVREQGSLSPPILPCFAAGFLFPSQTWEQLVFPNPLNVSSCPCFLFFLVFSDPSCGAQGRARDGAAKGSWSEQRYMDVERLRVRRKAKLSTNPTDSENEGKFASSFSPSCFHLKKEAAQKYSLPQPAKPDGP